MRSLLLAIALLASPVLGAGSQTFNGTNDYIETVDPAASLNSDSTWTVSLWAQRTTGIYEVDQAAISFHTGTSASTSRILYPFDTRNNDTSTLCANGGCGARWYMGSGFGDIDEQGNQRVGWYHFLVVSRSSTDREMYVDGVSVGTASSNFSMPASIGEITVGARSSSQQFYEERLAHVTVYGRTLTAAEISELAAGSIAMAPTFEPLHYWPLWESGTPFKDYGSTGQNLTCSACPDAAHDGPRVFTPGGAL